MEFNKPRPVPSKAALRVLYQLAYISSGTLVGAAALCAEERRRRTQVVQKIADNARRIRQSPRYNHASALAISADSEHIDYLEARNARRWGRILSQSDTQDGAMAPYLPSAIADGYSHLTDSAGLKNDNVTAQDTEKGRRSQESSPYEPRHQKPVPSSSPSVHDQNSHWPIASQQISRHPQHSWSASHIMAKPKAPVRDRETEISQPEDSTIINPTQSSLSFPSSADTHKLYRLWKRTQNLDVVLDTAQRLRKTASAPGAVEESLEIDLAEVEILLEGGRTEMAESALREMEIADGKSTNTDLLSAMLHAKLENWPTVFKHLDDLKVQLDDSHSTIETKSLNRFVQLYSTDQDCVSTWKFVTRLEEQYGFVPDSQTTAIITASIVIDGKYDLLPAWLNHMKVLGQPFKLHGMHAADLMTRYYHQHRPPADDLQRFCATLNDSQQDLAGHQYRNLIKAAISYDSSQRGGHVLPKHHGESLDHSAVLEKDSALAHPQTSVSATAPDHGLKGPPPMSRAETHADLLLALSQGQHERVVQLYRHSIDTDGLPMSAIALETAVKASIRLNKGDVGHANELLEQAWSQGFTRGSAQHILTIHQLQTMTSMEKSNVGLVRKTVQAYHDLMAGLRLVPVARVWLVAANILIRHGRADEGLELLRDFYLETPARLSQLSSSTMASFLSGFAATCHLKGVQWVVRTILENDIRISEAFLRAFRRVLRRTARQDSAKLVTHSSSSSPEGYTKWQTLLQELFVECKTRHESQRRRAVTEGQKLVSCLLECAKQQGKAAIPSQHRSELDHALFGTPFDFDSAQEQPGVSYDRDGSNLEGLKTALIREVGLTQVVHRQRRAQGDALWKLRYRRFYDRDVLLTDGAVACFRYFCPETEKTQAKIRFSSESNKQKLAEQPSQDAQMVHISVRSQSYASSA